MYEKKYEVSEIEVKEILFLFLKRLWIIILTGIICAAGAFLISKYLIKPEYRSTASIYIINRQDASKTTYTDLQTGSQLTKDIMFMINSRSVLESVIEKLDIDMTPKELADLISVNNPEGTRVLEISIVNKNPYLAKELADTIAIVASQNLVNIMEIEKINILEDGNLPVYPSSPDISRNTVIGAVLGCVIACFLILALHLMNDRIKNADDIEKYLGITTLAVIPWDEEVKKKKPFASKNVYQQEGYAS